MESKEEVTEDDTNSSEDFLSCGDLKLVKNGTDDRMESKAIRFKANPDMVHSGFIKTLPNGLSCSKGKGVALRSMKPKVNKAYNGFVFRDSRHNSKTRRPKTNRDKGMDLVSLQYFPLS